MPMYVRTAKRHRPQPESVCSLWSRGPSATRRLGRLLGQTRALATCCSSMDRFGAGKTCLTQGLAEGLGVPTETVVHSPSFTLVNQYQGRLPLLHADLYRLEHAEELA